MARNQSTIRWREEKLNPLNTQGGEDAARGGWAGGNEIKRRMMSNVKRSNSTSEETRHLDVDEDDENEKESRSNNDRGGHGKIRKRHWKELRTMPPCGETPTSTQASPSNRISRINEF